MVVCFIAWVMSEPMLYFKDMSGSDFTFPKSEVLQVYIALLNSMCLHNVFWDSLGATKLDIKFLVLSFFENIHLLLISKCFITLCGVVMDWYSCLCMLMLSTLKEVVQPFNLRCISPSCSCLMFCLRTSKSLSMWEFPKNLISPRARWRCSFSRSIPQRLRLNYWVYFFLSLLSGFKFEVRN